MGQGYIIPTQNKDKLCIEGKQLTIKESKGQAEVQTP